MEYKRLEIYTGWKCNHKCTFCIEYPNMDKEWEREITRVEIMKKLIKYRKKGFNHVTFLGGEPFIHKVFGFAIIFARRLGYTVMVTTNGSIIQFDKKAQEFLPNIDQLIISIPCINKEKQLLINRTKGLINFDKVFENIDKYWNGNFLKINTVINQRNLDEISKIISYVGEKGIKEISLTYPDIIIPYYDTEFVLDEVAPKYNQVSKYIKGWFEIANKYGINLMLTDIPFCCLPDIKYHRKTDDYVYQTRLKVDRKNKEIDREKHSPRRRKKIDKCEICNYKNICWGPSIHYNELYGIREINPIIQ